MLTDALGADVLAHQGVDEGPDGGAVQAPQALVGEVADAGLELEPHQVEEGEHKVGVARGVGGVLGYVEHALALLEPKDPIEDLNTDQQLLTLQLCSQGSPLACRLF